jgi:hypothetical protein
VLKAQSSFLDRQRSLVKGLGLRILALASVEAREVADHGGYVWMFPPEGLFSDRECPLIKGLGLPVFALLFVYQRQTIITSNSRPLRRAIKVLT